MFLRTIRHVTPLRALTLAALTALGLTACGGGGDNSSQPSASVEMPIAIEEVEQVAVHPLGARETSNPCTDSGDQTKYIRLGEGGFDAEKTLIDRHADCRLSQVQRVNLFADLTKSPEGVWSYAKTTTPVADVARYKVGEADLETRVAIWGPYNSLSKNLTVGARLRNFKGEVDYPHPVREPAMVLTPRLYCQAGRLTALASCTATKTSITVQLGSTTFATTEMKVDFGWRMGNRIGNFENFGVTIDQFAQRPSGAPADRPGGWPPETFNAMGVASLAKLRCDKGMVHGKEEGCVFPAASAIYDLTKIANIQEAIDHINEAQTGPIKAPGKFKGFKVLARAVADSEPDGSGHRYDGLQRTKYPWVNEANRDAACRNRDALIKVRLPLNASSSCGANSSGACSCDEYPFASTWSGAMTDPNRTSAKMILASHNSGSGSSILTNFLRHERVIDFAATASSGHGENDYYWVKVK